MVVDNLKNSNIYSGLSNEIAEGLAFLKQATEEIALGEHYIMTGVKAIVSEYLTKEHFEPGFESHKNVIDIQYPIKGLERVKWSPINNMNVKTPYDQIKDVAYFQDPVQQTFVDIGNGIFAIMFPEDGHGPQHYVDKPELIKKITIKISINH